MSVHYILPLRLLNCASRYTAPSREAAKMYMMDKAHYLSFVIQSCLAAGAYLKRQQLTRLYRARCSNS